VRWCWGASKKVLEMVNRSKMVIYSISLQGVTRRVHSCQNVFSSKNSPDVWNTDIVVTGKSNLTNCDHP
jgi:hypothetical protein